MAETGHSETETETEPWDCSSTPHSGHCQYTFLELTSLKSAVVAFDANVSAATATYGPISGWGVSAITSMHELFKDLSAFNADISGWETSGITNMHEMFRVRSGRAPNSTWTPPRTLLVSPRPTPLPSWPTITTHPAPIPQGASAFNQPLSLDTSKVTKMSDMFHVRSARALPPIPSRVFTCTEHAPPPPHTPSRIPARMLPTLYVLSSTRQGASVFNQSLSFDTSSVTTIRDMFRVRSSCALPRSPQLGPPLHAACAAAAP